MNKLCLILAACLIAGCTGDPMSSDTGTPRRFGPDEYGVACYTNSGGSSISCVQVQEGED